MKFHFPQEEGNFVHVYTGEAMTGLTWADNQPNNFDEQDCAMMEQNSSGIFDMCKCISMNWTELNVNFQDFQCLSILVKSDSESDGKPGMGISFNKLQKSIE